MNKIELLAPAGDIKCLIAAVQSGADAVYIGGDKFSARAYAANFNIENIKSAAEYCHLYGVKLYVTLNTLIKEHELQEALKYSSELFEAGVDALIVQDIGVAYDIINNISDFEVHASTQATIHNSEASRFLSNEGFSRIVLSRELSIEEIKYISTDMGIETEIFVHGALCICYSGMCLMSSMIGGRSGNRGRCAQPCRMMYTLKNDNTGESKKAYILSPKDICTIDMLEDIVRSGTKSLKIEGRMKRPEYVAGIVSSYRKALDAIYKGRSIDSKKEKSKMLQLFNREGFSKAYFKGNTGADMMAYNFPKNTGVFLGSACKDRSITLKEDIGVKDGVRVGFTEKGFIVSKIVKDGNEVSEAHKGENVFIKPSDFSFGDKLYKTSDSRLLDALEKSYKDKYGRKVSLSLEVNFKCGESILLKTQYDDKNFEVTGSIVQKALNKPVTMEKILSSLQKSGDTPFKFEKINFLTYEEGFIPVSELNEVRRKLVASIEEYILNQYKRAAPKEFVSNLHENKLSFVPETLICVSTKDQLKAVKEHGFEDYAIDIFGRNLQQKIDISSESNFFLRVPNILKGEFEEVCEIIDNMLESEKIKGIVTANLGIISRFSRKTLIVGDYKLNIFNSHSLNYYNKHNVFGCLSIELNRSEIIDISKHNSNPFEVLIYGKPELMVSEHCFIGSSFGGKTEKSSCNGCCKDGRFILNDRMGVDFLVSTDRYCRSHIYNSAAINLINYKEELIKMKGCNFRIDFIDENYEDVCEVLKSFIEGKWSKSFEKFTRGHYKRGVE